MSRKQAERVADAVLSEGYALYPYRADALKNRYRWQFGVLVPPAYAALPATEDDTLRAEVVLEPLGPGASLEVTVRAMHVEHRQVLDAEAAPVERLDVGGRAYVTWEQGVLRTHALVVPMTATGTNPVELIERWPSIRTGSPSGNAAAMSVP